MNDQNQVGIHDGELVRKQLARMGVSQAAFNKRMGWTDKHVYDQLKRKNWTTAQLQKAGEALNHNFFEAYAPSDATEAAQAPAKLVVPIAALADPVTLEQLHAQITAAADMIRHNKSQDTEPDS